MLSIKDKAEINRLRTALEESNKEIVEKCNALSETQAALISAEREKELISDELIQVRITPNPKW